MKNNKPEYGKQYALTGGKNDKCIMNGNTWAESEVITQAEEKKRLEADERMTKIMERYGYKRIITAN